MSRRIRVVAGVAIVLSAAACSSGTARVTGRPPVAPVVARGSTTYGSVNALLADTTVAVIATARSVAPLPSASSSAAAALVTMDVTDVFRGRVGGQIVVEEPVGPSAAGGGQGPIQAGQTYLLCLDRSAPDGPLFVVGGTAGLYRFDTATQIATRLDAAATWEPASFSLSEARGLLAPPQTPVTMPAGLTPPTTTIVYPNPYQPSYDTVASLADDSTFIVTGTVGPAEPGGYPIEFQDVLGVTEPKVTIGITTAEFDAAHLVVGGTYVFFYGADPVDNLMCIVGGVRGVFAYDPTTQIVTRLDQNPTSQIPRTQTLAQLQSAIDAAETVESKEPIANTPPLCLPAATGL